MAIPAQPALSFDKALTIRDGVIQTLLSHRLEANLYSPAKKNVFMQLAGDVGDLTSMQNHAGNRLNFVLNKVDFASRLGTQTIYARVPQRRPVEQGEGPRNPDVVRNVERMDFSFSPEYWEEPVGYDIESARYEGVLPFSDIAGLELQFEDTIMSMFNEMLTVRALGRLGMANRYGWKTFGIFDEKYNADNAAQINSNPDAKKFNTRENPLREPTEVVATWKLEALQDFRNNFKDKGGANPAADDQMSFAFLRQLRVLSKESENEMFRGLSFRPPQIMHVDDEQVGGAMHTRIPNKDVAACLFLNRYQIADLQDAEGWNTLQNNLATAMGVKQGISTGAVGDLEGLRIYEFGNPVIYPLASDNSMLAARGFMAGAGALLMTMPRYQQMPARYRALEKSYFKKVRDVDPSIEIRVKERGTHGKAAVFWGTNIGVHPVFWNAAWNPDKPLIGSIIAVDSVLSAKFT